MEQFLQSYGVWIIAGVFFLLMLRMHAGGAGCGMGHGDHQQAPDSRRQPVDDAASDEPSATATATTPTTTRRSGGCH
ncbi:MAG: hypothetical protein HY691_01330 [Chloroflexi bacterium]|nr:hypothetical protein [Chloroflexota bacterium]